MTNAVQSSSSTDSTVGKQYLPDVTLADEDASVVDGLGQSQFEHLRLQTALQEVLNLEAEHVIELHTAFIEHSDAHQATQQSITWNEQ